MKRRLSLDLGTNSIGWCLFDLSTTGDPQKIFKTGVRIFNDGRDAKSLGSLKATRREYRSSRRRRDRFIQRQKTLINQLVRSGLMPKDDNERKALALKDPYIIRKCALSMEMQPYEIGRAIFHINQRRGFKSNRKSLDNEAGVVKQSIADFDQKLLAKGAKTVGEFLASRKENMETVRARRLGDKSADLYEFYPDRHMLEQEFDKIWEAQEEFNPKLFSDQSHTKLKEIVFFQRKLKPQEVGRCTFLPEEYRISKALPSFQRFRIYQELHNLVWIDGGGVGHPVAANKELRDRLADELDKKKKLTFKQMRAILRKLGVSEDVSQFNLESDNRDHLVGNETACMMRDPKKMIGELWDKYSSEEQDAFIEVLLNGEISDDEASHTLRNTFHVPSDQIDACLDAKLIDGHGSLSKKAIDKIVPVMIDQGLGFYDAVKEAGFGEANLYDPDRPLAPKLDYYGKALSGHVLNASGKPEDSDEKRYGIITNPTVHIALNQVKAVVNELVRFYGKPEEIVLELARDLPLGAKGKRELQKIQGDNLKRNEATRKELETLKIIDSREDRQKHQLWSELSADPTERCCVFSGKVIPISKLFSSEIEVEHLLPFSQTFDDSLANKTVCYRQANRDKGNNTPFEAFGDSSDGYVWEEILERSSKFKYGKRWRFLPDAMKRFDEEGGFLERQLNDTRYISRYTSQYLETIVPKNKIWVVTGRLTALLRGFWGLNSILRGHNEDPDKKARKLRDDHRHHAIDAVVVGMISRGLLGSISKAARRSEDQDLEKLFDAKIDPWKDFRSEVSSHINDIIVSHRPRKKAQGSLHNDTAYGLVNHSETGPSEVVRRLSIENFGKIDDLKKIRDDVIREALLKEADGLKDDDLKEAVSAWCRDKGIKSLRILETLSVIPITDKSGKNYKAYKGDGNAYLEIYCDPKTNKWMGEIVSRFDANKKNFIPAWRRQFPEEKLQMRLRINDIFSSDLDGVSALFRIQKLSGNTITCAPLNEANVDSRNRDKGDTFKYSYFSPLTLQNGNAKQLYISPTGLIGVGSGNDRKSSRN